MRLEDRVALVTGAGRGIGRDVALALAREGARIVVNDLDDLPAAETVSLIEDLGGRAVACAGSVVDPGFADRFTATAVQTYGGIDIVVNNAGFTWDSVIQKMTDDRWDAIVDVHLTAPFRILRAVQPIIAAAAKAEIAQQGTARARKVVNISSVSGLSGNAGQANYASAKAGVTGLTRALAKEWGRYNVTVNAVAFGLIETRLTSASAAAAHTIDIEGRQIAVGVSPAILDAATSLIPLGRPGTTAEAAGAVLLMCLPESDYISGQTIVCGGGWNG